MSQEIKTVEELDSFDQGLIMCFLPLSVLKKLKKIADNLTLDGGETTSSAIEEMKAYQEKLEEISI